MHVSLSQHYSCYCRSCQPDLSTAASVSLCPEALLTSNQGLCYMLQSTQPQLWSARGYAIWSLTASSDLIFPYSSYLHSTKVESWPACCSNYSPGPGPSYSQSLLGMLVLSKAGSLFPVCLHLSLNVPLGGAASTLFWGDSSYLYSPRRHSTPTCLRTFVVHKL